MRPVEGAGHPLKETDQEVATDDMGAFVDEDLVQSVARDRLGQPLRQHDARPEQTDDKWFGDPGRRHDRRKGASTKRLADADESLAVAFRVQGPQVARRTCGAAPTSGRCGPGRQASPASRSEQPRRRAACLNEPGTAGPDGRHLRWPGPGARSCLRRPRHRAAANPAEDLAGQGRPPSVPPERFRRRPPTPSDRGPEWAGSRGRAPRVRQGLRPPG